MFVFIFVIFFFKFSSVIQKIKQPKNNNNQKQTNKQINKAENLK